MKKAYIVIAECELGKYGEVLILEEETGEPYAIKHELLEVNRVNKVKAPFSIETK